MNIKTALLSSPLRRVTDIHTREWPAHHHTALHEAKTFSRLKEIALDVIDRLPGRIHMVSGPISTGGVGSVSGNMRIFRRTIEILHDETGLNVFSQMLFEPKMGEIYVGWRKENPNAPYCMPILQDFYLPIFKSGKLEHFHFIPNWKSSFGARWEHKQCAKHGVNHVHLPRRLVQRIIEEYRIPQTGPRFLP